jgi:hypothetical protein
MPDIAPSFDETPSRDGGAMSELWFHDLVPAARPSPSLFELMWNQALASVTPARSDFDGLGPPVAPAPREAWPQTSLESAAQSAEPARDEPPSQSPEPTASPSIDATDEPATVLRSPADGSQAAQPKSAEPSEDELPDQPSDTLPEKPAVQTTPVLPSENNELRFDDLIPDESEAARPPILDQGQEADRDRLSQTALGIRHDSGQPLDAPITGMGHNEDPPPNRPIGIGYNGGLPLEDSPAWQLFKARLLRSTGLGLLLSALAPTPLNPGDAEYIASIFPWPYGKLTRRLPQDFQANHLNQNAAYRDVIPEDEGIAVGTRGDAVTEPSTPHYFFHQSLEQFWDPYRSDGELYGQLPINSMYGQALERALLASGRSPEEASYLAGQAAAQRAKYGLMEWHRVPRIPNRLNQVQMPE